MKKITKISPGDFIFNSVDNNYYCDISISNATSVFVTPQENVNLWATILNANTIRVFSSFQPLSFVGLVINYN